MGLYRLILAALMPIFWVRALWRGETLGDLAQRLGFGQGPARADVWLHGASLGELASARWVLQDLQGLRPGLRVLVTANSLTGRQMVQGWGTAGVEVRLAPYDLPGPTRRVLAQVRPRVMLNLEAEIWPTRFAQCATGGVPVVLLGARMSARSFHRWQRFSGLLQAALSHVALASAQDVLSRQHLRTLGLAEAAVLPDLDLKAEAVARRLPAAPLPRGERADWLLAASTHESEEAVVLDAFAAQSRFAHLIIAPRHPARAAAIVALLTARGMEFGQRSRGDSPGAQAVFLADSLGEMDAWYRLCGACFIGGTLADKGGHTPWEPVHHSSAILHGPSLWNFTDAFAALDGAGAALPVTAQTLPAALDSLLPQQQNDLAATALRVLQAKGDAGALLARIVTYL